MIEIFDTVSNIYRDFNTKSPNVKDTAMKCVGHKQWDTVQVIYRHEAWDEIWATLQIIHPVIAWYFERMTLGKFVKSDMLDAFV